MSPFLRSGKSGGTRRILLGILRGTFRRSMKVPILVLGSSGNMRLKANVVSAGCGRLSRLAISSFWNSGAVVGGESSRAHAFSLGLSAELSSAA